MRQSTQRPAFLVQSTPGRPFQWPAQPQDEYLLAWKNRHWGEYGGSHSKIEHLLVLQSGIASLNFEKGPSKILAPDWLRVTDHVVIENPDGKVRHSPDLGLLLDLGIVAGWLKHQSNPDDAVICPNPDEWNKTYLPVFRDLAENTHFSASTQLKVFQGWAACADWKSAWVKEVAAAAMFDFRDHQYRDDLIESFKACVVKAQGDWADIENQAVSMEAPNLYLGPKLENLGDLIEENETEVKKVESKPPPPILPLQLSRQKDVAEFCWPKTGDSFYVVKPKNDALILCMPSYLQVFPEGYPVDPGEGFHFLRLSDHVVLQMPARIPEEAFYREIIEGLGITVAQVPYSSFFQDFNDKVLNNYNRWAALTMPLVPLVLHEDYQGLDDLILPLFEAWVDHADWECDATRSVVVALAKDLSTSSGWQSLEEGIRKHLKDSEVEALKTLGLARRTVGAQTHKKKGPKYSLGAPYTPGKASLVLKKTAQRIEKAKTEENQLRDPEWTISRRNLLARGLSEFRDMLSKIDFEDQTAEEKKQARVISKKQAETDAWLDGVENDS